MSVADQTSPRESRSELNAAISALKAACYRMGWAEECTPIWREAREKRDRAEESLFRIIEQHRGGPSTS